MTSNRCPCGRNGGHTALRGAFNLFADSAIPADEPVTAVGLAAYVLALAQACAFCAAGLLTAFWITGRLVH